MTSTISSLATYVDDDFLLRQRGELDARRLSYREQVERLSVTADELADAGAYGACRACRRPIPLARLEAVPEATQCVRCATGSLVRQR